MAKSTQGYLANDGTFYTTHEEAQAHDNDKELRKLFVKISNEFEFQTFCQMAKANKEKLLKLIVLL